MKALGDLAADDLTAYDKDFDALNKSVVATKFFKELKPEWILQNS